LLGVAFVVSEGAFGPERAVGLKYSDRSAQMPSASKVRSQKFFSSMGKMQPELHPGGQRITYIAEVHRRCRLAFVTEGQNKL
jgi:hypothetical protein